MRTTRAVARPLIQGRYDLTGCTACTLALSGIVVVSVISVPADLTISTLLFGAPLRQRARRTLWPEYVAGSRPGEDRVQEELAGQVYLQPESSEPLHVQKALEVLGRHPHWRLSCRVHQILGLP